MSGGATAEPLLRVEDLHVFFDVRRGAWFDRETILLKAVDGVSCAEDVPIAEASEVLRHGKD